ncbi:MAG: hypothetical protein QOF42_885 [Gammaproteobacteria bacterium]|jgi:hypothetical protein|nr:hypothetical protein [Gammaproteobacteria bacterium]
MRFQLRSIAPALVGTCGMLMLNVAALAGSGDSASTVRGSLGGSLSDLSLEDGAGIGAFILNASFALAFVVAARMMTRHAWGQSGAKRGPYSNVAHVTQGFG